MDMLMLKSVTAILSPMVPQYTLTTSARLTTLHRDLDTDTFFIMFMLFPLLGILPHLDHLNFIP